MNPYAKSLERRFNKKLLALWAVGAVCLVMAFKPWPVLPAVIGALAGGVIGTLQLRSLSQSPELFAAAGTANEVRRAFWSTASGRWSIILLWVAAFAVLGVSLGYGGNPLRGYLAGYLSLLLFRDSVTLRATRAAEHAG